MFKPSVGHGIGSPGYALEDEFDTMLYHCELVDAHTWNSEHKKAMFDFTVHSNGGSFLIDVVSFGYKGKSLELRTHHKSWLELLDYAHEQGVRRCYLAYKPFEFNSDKFLDWRFIKITDKLPNGNLYLSKARAKAGRTYKYLFADKRTFKTKLANKVKYKYALRKKADRKLMEWIYGDVSPQ